MRIKRFFTNRERFPVLIIFLFAFFLRLGILFITENGRLGEPWVRILLAQEWMKEGGFVSNVTAPLHIWLLGAGLSLWNNPLILPRIINLLFGAFFIFPFYYLLRSLFNNNIAILSSLVVCLYPLHIKFSVLSTAEVPFAFFIFCSLYFFTVFLMSPSRNMIPLIISAILLNLAGGFRFEGWFFIPILSLFLIREKKKYMLLFFSLSMVFPIYWITQHYIHTHRLFPFMEDAVLVTKEHFLAFGLTNFYDRLFSWIKILCKTLTPYVTISGFAGLIYYCLVLRKYIFLGMVFLAFFSLFTLSTVNMTFYAFPRYSILLALLLVPYSILCLHGLFRFINKKLRFIFLFFFVLLLINSFLRGIMEELPEMRVNPETKQVALWLKEHVSTSDSILLDWDYSFGFSIPVISGLGYRRCVWAPLKFRGEIRGLDEGGLFTILKENRPRYMVVFFTEEGYLSSGEAGKLREFFQLDIKRETEERFGYRLKPVFKSPNYIIYELFRKV